jgi:Tol biopolymer transport system component
VLLSGGEVRQLTNDEHSSSPPVWLPDGERRSFISGRDGEDQNVKI